MATSWNLVGKTIGNASNATPASSGAYYIQHSCSLAFNPSTHELYITYMDANNTFLSNPFQIAVLHGKIPELILV